MAIEIEITDRLRPISDYEQEAFDMTDKELRRLTRTDLLDLLIIERQEIDRLLAEQNKINEDLDVLNGRLENISRELADAQKLLKNSFLLADHGATRS